MKKRILDERQAQITANIGTYSFYVMFFLCAALILVELFWHGTLENILGETILLLAGGATCLGGYLKNGLWPKKCRQGILSNLLTSTLCASLFTIFYAATFRR